MSTTANHLRAVLRDDARHADRIIMLPLLWALYAISLGLAQWYWSATWTLAIWAGLVLALVPSILIAWWPGTRATRIAVAISFMLFCALHIHQAMGTIELHFGIFVLLAVLLCYRDWLVILVGALVIALHHVGFNRLQEFGFPAYCFAKPGFGRVVVHAAYVVVETVVLCYIAHWLNGNARQANELAAMVGRLAQDDRIDLTLVGQRASSPAAVRLQHVLAAVASAVGNVQHNVEAIDHALDGMRTGNRSVSDGASNQVDAIGESAVAIRSITDSLATERQRTEAAEQALGQTTDLAREGSAAMTQSVESMREIRALSQQISEITTLIDGLAFQTNILALNAAVEAARASSHGRGFAVVAGEVRDLAQRSADASRRIRDLIGASVSRIADGTAHVERSGSIMEKLSCGIGGLSETLAQLLAANHGQHQRMLGLEQSITKVQAIAHDNLQHAQGTASLMQSLDSSARGMNMAVGQISV